MPLALPLEKTAPTLSASSSKVLLYGAPKVGKSTLAAGLPGKTLFLACEPGLGGLDVFQVPVRSWQDFRDVCAALDGEHDFDTVVVDTVDELFRFCSDAAMKELGIQHPSDLGYGKGWAAVRDKFSLGVGYVANQGLGVWFISHAKDIEIKQRIGTINKTVPSIGGSAREFLVGFCDHIFFADFVETDAGKARVLHTEGSENWEAGSRTDSVRLASPLPMDPKAVIAALGSAA